MLLTPSNDPFASDEEEGDDDIGLSGNISLQVDVSGIVKSHTDGSDDTDASNNDGLDKHIRKQMRENGKTEPTYLISIPIGTKMEKLKMLLKGFPQLLDLSELESCK